MIYFNDYLWIFQGFFFNFLTYSSYKNFSQASFNNFPKIASGNFSRDFSWDVLGNFPGLLQELLLEFLQGLIEGVCWNSPSNSFRDIFRNPSWDFLSNSHWNSFRSPSRNSTRNFTDFSISHSSWDLFKNFCWDVSRIPL